MNDIKYWIQTHTGERINPAEIRPEQIHIEDIAHALSFKCRFTGHCPVFYSVAQHSIHVAENCPPEAMLAGLLHDAHEAYLADIAGPTKQWLRDQGNGISRWDWLEMSVQAIIHAKFNVPDDEATLLAVKLADVAMLNTEARAFFGGTQSYKEYWPKGDFAAYPQTLVPWPSTTAKEAFLQMFHGLT